MHFLHSLKDKEYEITEVKKGESDQKCTSSVYNKYSAAGSCKDAEFFYTENHASGTAAL